MAKSILRLKARELRKQGLGVKTIAHQLYVSSSTASLWCRDIKLTSDQIKELERRSHDPFYGKRLQYVQKQQIERQQRIQKLQQVAIQQLGKLSERELLTAGICLYWAEGFKKDSQAGFANSDPEMIRFFITWLEKCCKIGKSRLKLRVGINEQYKDKIVDVEKYWAKLLSVSLEQFQKPFFQRVQWKKVYDHPEDYHGVLRIRVSKSTDFLRTIEGWVMGLRKNVD